MKHRVLFSVCLLLTSTACSPDEAGPAEPSDHVRRSCGSAGYRQNAVMDPDIAARDEMVELAVQDYAERSRDNDKRLRGERIVIPVVVHILHEGEDDASNISDGQVESGIEALNRDFRAANTDISTVPAEFEALVVDPRIEFVLAQRDPDCNATTGITRQRAGNEFYSLELDDAKQSASGGVDPWDPEEYLNIWVVDELLWEGVPILGYSSAPAHALESQGFVSEHKGFGTTGTAGLDPAYALGRTAVHEFGHFFNLRHIWGDDDDQDSICESPGECAGSDLVDDTPNAGEPNFFVPAFPLTDCCSTEHPGVLFMNYMDYVDDPAMVMFTAGQVDRMVASLYTTMATLLASDARFPPPPSDAPDLLMLDTPADLGNEPNTESDVFHLSEDIWIRTGADGETNQEHQNPVGSATATVYVRVRNRGCGTSDGGTLTLYWAKASTGLSWEDPWTGDVVFDGAVMGGIIGEVPIDPLDGGESDIYSFEWMVPNPEDYTAFGMDKSHFCLLARIEEPSGFAFPETTDLYANVQNNNNIVWKNVTISSPADDAREAHTSMANFGDDAMDARISFEDLASEESAFGAYDLYVELDPELLARWTAAGTPGDRIQVQNDGTIRLLAAGAFLEGLVLQPGDIFGVRVIAVPLETLRQNSVYFLNVQQGADGNLIGGQGMIF